MAEWVATSGLESSWNQPAFNCKACGMKRQAARVSTLILKKTARTRAHRAADCTAPRDNTCRYCKAEGHMIRDCPQKPPMVCGNCGQEGHLRKNCENSRLINRDHIADVTPDDALEKIKIAASQRDVDDVKEAVQEYIKSVHGEVNYHELQNMFINQDVNLWLIATERQLVNVFTNMDLQGNTGKKYTISYRFSEKPERPREIEGWPKSRAELLDRLHDAGEVVDSGQIRCHICREVGHAARFCTQERAETNAQPAISCSNCAAEGHRLRDCPEPRVDKSACRNCGKSGHRASDCEEPPNLDNVECRKCGEKGHFGKDCPQGGSRACHNCGQDGHMSKECDQPRNMANVTCRNCDQTGHMSRECPQPTDWSKVQCSNCKQFGHTHVRCKEPVVDEGMGFGGAGETSNDQGGASGWNSGGGNVGDIPAVDSAW
ncbi:hypothetical protein E4U31_000344 [Claviceps sp. LM219 group G6]|nr:hypothetical protein E4U31_000344 [Claviceps sp. LM219 group G6]KAG6115462.1 hypothetical protein E4U14_000847 [Claviceps sp. LM454 group G7]